MKFLGALACMFSDRTNTTTAFLMIQIPVTYAGGVTTMEDLERIKIAGAGSVDVTVGSALDIFGGNLAYKQVVAWHAQQHALAL